jgi:hypothetical protein
MAFEEDFSEFLDTDDFAVTATLSDDPDTLVDRMTTESGDPMLAESDNFLITEQSATIVASESEISGIFRDSYYRASETNSGVAVESLAPMFICEEALVSSVAHGDEITVDSVLYKIIHIEPDGTGLTTLHLEVQ